MTTHPHCLPRPWMAWASAVFFVLLGSAPVSLVLAQSARVALVVGVSDYQHVPRLRNPANDAREVARRLERFGFHVERLSGQPISKRDFDDALVRLRQRSVRADAVVVYFAGHGIELGGQNYLLPSDARLVDERDVRREAVALDDVLAELRSERTGRVNIVILDACRENPFRSRLAAGGRSVSRGLARPDVRMNGTLIAFATAANDVAADGAIEQHSPYTQALLDVMDREPQLEVGLFFRRVRAQVLQRAPTQQPWEHGSLLEEFYFANPLNAVTPQNRNAVENAERLRESQRAQTETVTASDNLSTAIGLRRGMSRDQLMLRFSQYNPESIKINGRDLEQIKINAPFVLHRRAGGRSVVSERTSLFPIWWISLDQNGNAFHVDIMDRSIVYFSDPRFTKQGYTSAEMTSFGDWCGRKFGSIVEMLVEWLPSELRLHAPERSEVPVNEIESYFPRMTPNHTSAEKTQQHLSFNGKTVLSYQMTRIKSEIVGTPRSSQFTSNGEHRCDISLSIPL